MKTLKDIKKNEIYTITIESLSQDGEGVGRINGFVVFCDGLLPGEKAEIRIVKVTSSYAVGRVTKLIDKSQNRINPECAYSTKCGGCTFSHIEYKAQLETKQQYVVDCLSRIGGIKDYTLIPIKGMDNPYKYRNKAQYPFGVNIEGKVVSGFFSKRSHDLVPIDLCLTEDERAQKVRKFVSEYITDNNITVYDESNNKGLIRNVVVRTSHLNDNAMVILVLSSDTFPDVLKFINALKITCPFVVSVYFNINDKVTNVILGEEFKHIYGDERLLDTIDGVNFLISPDSFFQVNPLQTVQLYQTVALFSDVQEDDTVFDIYCGIGTIGIYLASKFKIKKLVGVEYVKHAVEDAIINAQLNHIENASFYEGDATEVVTELKHKETIKHFDIVVVDPPRKGCDEKLLELLINIQSPKIVYVSCNPASLARDLKYLTANGYSVNKVCPVDLFPWTSHVETVVFMSNKDK